MIIVELPDYDLEYAVMAITKKCIETHDKCHLDAHAVMLGVSHSTIYKRFHLLRTDYWEKRLGKLNYNVIPSGVKSIEDVHDDLGTVYPTYKKTLKQSNKVIKEKRVGRFIAIDNR